MFALVSSLVVPWVVTAHEVDPAVVNVAVGADQIEMRISMTLEAVLAGIDLEAVENTDDTAQSADYDALRALEPAALQDAFHAYWPQMQNRLQIVSGGQPLQPQLQSVIVPEVGNIELPRTSEMTLTVDRPAGQPVQIGWDRSFGAMILRQISDQPDAFTGYLAPGQLSPPLSDTAVSAETGWQTFVRYVPVGFDHIIPKGLDHILFVLGLFFLAARLGPLIWQISAFTLAHTVTLALGALGLVNIAPEIVEPLIAASIVYVAVENIFAQKLTPWRPAVIFAFGLLHGLGFASVLGEFGLPTAQFIPALIGFNVGVEVGQLTVIAIAFLAVGLWFRNKSWYRPAIAIPASCIIAAVGAFWFVERVFLA